MHSLFQLYMSYNQTVKLLLDASHSWSSFCEVRIDTDKIKLRFYSLHFQYSITLLDEMVFQVVVKGCPAMHCWFTHRVRFGYIVHSDLEERAVPDSFHKEYSIGEFMWCVKQYAGQIVPGTPKTPRPGRLRLKSRGSAWAESEIVPR